MLTASVLRYPDKVKIVTEGAETVQTAGVPEVHAAGVTLSFVLNELGHMEVMVSAPNAAPKQVALRWQGTTAPGIRVLADAWERSYGDLGFLPVIDNRSMPWYFVTSRGEQTTGCGVMTRPRAFCFWLLDARGVTLWLDVRNGGRGVRLGQRQLHAATIVQKEYQNLSSFEAARAFCSEMSQGAVFPQKPVYGSNNWYYAYGNSSQDEIVEDAKYVARLTEGLKNRPYMVIDDGWQTAFRTFTPDYNGGPWHTGNQKFPDMERLAQEMSACGVLPGIWFRPLQDQSDSLPASCRLKRDERVLDPTVPEVLERVRKDTARLNQWGYRLIKHDFSTYDLFGKWGMAMQPLVTEDGWGFADDSLTSAEVVQRFYQAVFEGAGDSLVLGCNCIGHLGVGYMQLNRTGDDTSGVKWERTRKMGINTLAFRLPQNGAFYAVDADCVGMSSQILWSLNRQWLKLLGYSGTPLFFSVKPGTLSEEEERELKSVLAFASQNEKEGVPLNWQDTFFPDQWELDGQKTQFDWADELGAGVL